MGYRRALLTRWSRRDKLAILVIAVTIGFLTGTTLVIAAASTQTTTIAQEYGTDGTAVYYESLAQARDAAGENELVIPMATVRLPNGDTRYVAGISDQQANAFEKTSDISIPSPPESGVTSGTRNTQGRLRLEGNRRTLSVAVAPRPSTHGLFPPDWYVAQPDVVTKMGTSGALVITPPNGTGTGIPTRGVTLRSALAFFVVGTRQLLTVLSLTAVGGMVLVGVTIYSVMRMTVRDRIESIRVLRSTGCRPRTILELFALRAGLLTVVGVGMGYAIGVILPHIAVNAAVSLGLPTSLTVHISPFVLTILLPMYVGTVLVSFVAGGVAAWPTSKTAPARVNQAIDRGGRPHPSQGRLRNLFTLRLLDWRALGPSTATLTVFITVILLVTSLAGVMTPLMSTQGTTLTEPGAIHPVASTVPERYADALRMKGIPASAEILLFAVHDGQPIVARGANYSAFATISNASLKRGRKPTSATEAVIGVDLARTAGLSVGDSITLGGSTHTGLARVHIVGTYSAPGLYDDQILVSLPVARQLSSKTEGSVHIVRTAKRISPRASTSPVELLDVSTPSQIESNSSIPVQIRLRNFGSETAMHNVSVRLGNASKSVSVELEPESQRTVTVHLPTPRPGTTTLRVGNETQPVTVISPDSIQVRGVPANAPPNSTPRVVVSTVHDTPLENASIRISQPNREASTTVRTDANGTAGIPLGSVGTTTLHVTARNRTVRKTVNVTQSASRAMVADIQIQPTNPSLLTRTRARVRLYNPWNTTLNRRLRLTGDVGGEQRTVSVPAGATGVETFRIGEQTPGSHTVSIESGGRRLASTSYTVSGDDRLVAAYASSGGSAGGTGIGRALNTAFGNLQILLAVLVLLAGLMTVGSTTAAFAQAVHARQQPIGVYRATGARPTRVLRLVIADAFIIGLVAVSGAILLGMSALLLLDQLNYLVVYGVRISPTLTPGVVVGSVIGGLTIILLSAGLVTSVFSRRQPATLVRNNGVSDERVNVPEWRGSDD